MATRSFVTPPTNDQKLKAFEQLVIYLIDWYGELDNQLAQQITNKYNKIFKKARLNSHLFIYENKNSSDIYISIVESDDIPLSIIAWIVDELLNLDESNPHATDCPVLMGEINSVLHANNINMVAYPFYLSETSECRHAIQIY